MKETHILRDAWVAGGVRYLDSDATTQGKLGQLEHQILARCAGCPALGDRSCQPSVFVGGEGKLSVSGDDKAMRGVRLEKGNEVQRGYTCRLRNASVTVSFEVQTSRR